MISMLLASFEEVPAPPGVQVRGDALTPPQFGDALLASKAVEYDADLLFGSKPAARLPSDLAHCRFTRLLLLGRHKDTLLGDEIPAMCLLVSITHLSESVRRETVQ
jgi:hypothetical protein